MVQVLLEPKSADDALVFYLGHLDGGQCPCGNDPTLDGFVYLEDDLTVSDIRAGSGAMLSRLLCVSCGRVFTWRADVERPHSDAEDYWVRYDGVGDLVARLTAEQAAAAWQQFEVYAGG